MSKFKVFLANGVIHTVVAHGYSIEWITETAGRLRFTIDDKVMAVFPPGGWHGVQDMEVYRKVAV